MRFSDLSPYRTVRLGQGALWSDTSGATPWRKFALIWRSLVQSCCHLQWRASRWHTIAVPCMLKKSGISFCSLFREAYLRKGRLLVYRVSGVEVIIWRKEHSSTVTCVSQGQDSVAYDTHLKLNAVLSLWLHSLSEVRAVRTKTRRLYCLNCLFAYGCAVAQTPRAQASALAKSELRLLEACRACFNSCG